MATMMNHGPNGSESSECPKSKKCFPSREAALKFEEENQAKYPDRAKQHAYACEDCPNWHLSALPPESQAMLRSRSYFPPVSQDKATRHGMSAFESRKPEIAALFKQGLSFNAISEQTGIPYYHVYNFCVALGLHQPKTNPRISEGLRANHSNPVVSIEALASEEEALQAKLRQVQTKKQQLIEAKMLRIGPHNGSGVVIRKEGNVLALSFSDAQELVERLIDYLSNRPPAN
jgi:hypothetical protein